MLPARIELAREKLTLLPPPPAVILPRHNQARRIDPICIVNPAACNHRFDAISSRPQHEIISNTLFCALVTGIYCTAVLKNLRGSPRPDTSLYRSGQGAPGARQCTAEIDTTKSTDNLIAGRPLVRLGNVSIPTLTVYSPPGHPCWFCASRCRFPRRWISNPRHRS